MTLHTRPIQTQSIPLLQQGNLGNTQGILTAVTQWPLIRRHHHFLMSSKLSEHIFLGSKYFLSEERQIFPARGSGSLGLVSSYPSPRLRHLGSGSGDVTRHGVFSWEMCLSEQWIRSSETLHPLRSVKIFAIILKLNGEHDGGTKWWCFESIPNIDFNIKLAQYPHSLKGRGAMVKRVMELN